MPTAVPGCHSNAPRAQFQGRPSIGADSQTRKVADLRHNPHSIDQSQAAHGLDRSCHWSHDQLGKSSMICRVNRATRCSAAMTASM